MRKIKIIIGIAQIIMGICTATLGMIAVLGKINVIYPLIFLSICMILLCINLVIQMISKRE